MEALAVVLIFDRLLDMCRTAVNVLGDSVGAVIIAKTEGESDVLKEI
jgi:DAACS family dicarboxylate/amino acid:cation (Na+ or H+) symporter